MAKYPARKFTSVQAEIMDEDMHQPKLIAKDAMIRPTFFSKDDDMEKIIRKLKREDCDVSVVIDSEKNFLGEIDDGDLVRIMAQNAMRFPITKILNRCYKRGLSWRNAKDLARKHNNIVREDTPINKVLEKIYRKGSRNIIVINKQSKVSGVITSSSLLRLLSEH